MTTEPSTSSTTSTSTSSTTTTTNTTSTSVVPSTTVPVFVPAIPTTTSTTALPTTTTTEAPPTTTSTVEPTTTTTSTTAPPEQQDLGLVCVTREATSVVVCEWSESRNETFARFRLWKHTGDGPDQEVYSGSDTRHEGTERVGARMIYEVTALDREGNVLGHGDATITCC